MAVAQCLIDPTCKEKVKLNVAAQGLSTQLKPVVAGKLGKILNRRQHMTQRNLHRIVVQALIVIAPLLSVQAQTKLGPKDGEGLPPTDLQRVKAGERAPDFSLEDHDGKVVTLSDYRDRRAVVLVFYRGYW